MNLSANIVWFHKVLYRCSNGIITYSKCLPCKIVCSQQKNLHDSNEISAVIAKENNAGIKKLDRDIMNEVVRKRFFYDSSFNMYGAISGQYDFGPYGTSLLDKIVEFWQMHFVIKNDRVTKIKCPVLTPESVLKTSGHVDKFSDFVVKDPDTGECFRADHLIKENLEKILNSKEFPKEASLVNRINGLLVNLDNLEINELKNVIKEFDIKLPNSNKKIIEIEKRNLMFPIQFGPSLHSTKGFLRPETAQGTLTNFKRLLKFYNKLPFACAQVGPVFRNEISPKSGLIRVREFLTAEIQHFSEPHNLSHSKFNQIKNHKLLLYTSENQEKTEAPIYISISEALEIGILKNEISAYYLAKILEFLKSVGVDGNKLRFRQHRCKELAHYALDCWDVECLTSYGWIECVGLATRADFDLRKHSEYTGCDLRFEKPLTVPRKEDVFQFEFNNKLLKETFAHNYSHVKEVIENLDSEQVLDLNRRLDASGNCNLNTFTLTRKHLPKIKKKRLKILYEKIFPHVTEPSFGLERIFYVILEHNFRIRKNDSKRVYFKFNPQIAPVPVAILPIVKKLEFDKIVSEINEILIESNLESHIDWRGTIGRRYVRYDEIGVPFCVTVDDASLNDRTVTIRDRDSTSQVKIPISKVAEILLELCDKNCSWQEVCSKFELSVC